MEDLHSDAIEKEILLRLPFKSVVRWMCTSKFWYGRIRSPEFSRNFLKKTIDADTDRCLLLSTAGFPPTSFFRAAFDDNDNKMWHDWLIKQPLYHPQMHTRVVGQSNGLVCICNHNYPKIMRDVEVRALNERKVDEFALAIWNPSIHRFKMVPTLPLFSLPTRDANVLRCPPSYGFANNSKVDDYEVVEIRQCGNTQTRIFTSEVRIYTLGTNEWRRIGDLDAKYNRFVVAKGYLEGKLCGCPFVNGHMHWLMENSQGNSCKILAFDVENEEFVDYGIPPVEAFLELHLHSLGDRFYLLERRENTACVWIMTEYKNEHSWIGFSIIWYPPSSISFFPLLNSKTGRGTLYLVSSEDSNLWWMNHTARHCDLHFFRYKMLLQGTSFVQSFLMGDGEPIPHDDLATNRVIRPNFDRIAPILFL